MAKKDPKLTRLEAKFCNAVAKGDKTIKECLLEVYPRYRGKTRAVVDTQAHRLVTRPKIMAEIARIKESFAEVIEEDYTQLKREMVDRMVKGIRAGTDGDPLTIVEFVPAIRQLSTMLGWDAPKDVTIRNGGVSADYKGPPTLITMTDEQITEKLKELRGE